MPFNGFACNLQKRGNFKLFLLGLFTFFLSSEIIAQTTLDHGDIAIIGVNANNNACSGYSGAGEDIISFVAFKDITNGTALDITDNGWERLVANRFGETEGTFRFTNNGGTISAGTTFNLTFRGSFGEKRLR